MTTPTQLIHGLSLRDVSLVLSPDYLDHPTARPMVRRELLAYDQDHEVYRCTPRGDDLVKEIRVSHGLHFVDGSGGGRWCLDGIELHCGNAIQVLLPDGIWLPVRFEIVHSDHVEARNGRLPRFYISTAGGPSLAARVDHEDWKRPIFRWPPKQS